MVPRGWAAYSWPATRRKYNPAMRTHVVLVLVVVLLASFLARGGDEKRTLEDRVRSLEERVAKLEARATPGFRGLPQDRKDALVACKDLYDKCHYYKLRLRRFPRTLAELEKPLGGGSKPFTKLPKDPWGHDYRAEADGRDISIYSVGPDGKPNTADDVRYADE